MCDDHAAMNSQKVQALYFGNGFVGSIHMLSDYPGETIEGLKMSLGHEVAMYMCHEMYDSLEDYNRDNNTGFGAIAELAATNAMEYSQVFDPAINGAETSAIEDVRRRLFKDSREDQS
jgi:predicted hydrocarbon binding protein